MDVKQDLQELKQSMLQIVSLSEIYGEVLKKGKTEEQRLEAEYARDQILKISMHAKRILADMERQERVQ